MCLHIKSTILSISSTKTVHCQRVGSSNGKRSAITICAFLSYFFLNSWLHTVTLVGKTFLCCLHYSSKNIILNFPTNFYLNGRVGNSGMEEAENFKDESPRVTHSHSTSPSLWYWWKVFFLVRRSSNETFLQAWHTLPTAELFSLWHGFTHHHHFLFHVTLLNMRRATESLCMWMWYDCAVSCIHM